MRFAWGIDVAADGFAISVVDQAGAHVAHVDERNIGQDTSLERRVRVIHEHAEQAMWDLAADHRPWRIVIEQPVGKWPAPKLMAAWGVVTSAAVVQAGEAVVWMSPPVWRKASATGQCTDHGAELLAEAQAARFAEVGRYLPKAHPLRSVEKQRALARAREAGYEGWSVDVADATCIALAGLTLKTKEGN